MIIAPWTKPSWPWCDLLREVLGELGSCATWSLATAPLALVQPDEHVSVRPTSFTVQAQVLAPQLAYTKQPSVALYEGYRTTALTACKRLREAGLTLGGLVLRARSSGTGSRRNRRSWRGARRAHTGRIQPTSNEARAGEGEGDCTGTFGVRH